MVVHANVEMAMVLGAQLRSRVHFGDTSTIATICHGRR